MALVIYLIVDHAWGRGRAIFLAALTAVWLSYLKNYGNRRRPWLPQYNRYVIGNRKLRRWRAALACYD